MKLRKYKKKLSFTFNLMRSVRRKSTNQRSSSFHSRPIIFLSLLISITTCFLLYVFQMSAFKNKSDKLQTEINSIINFPIWTRVSDTIFVYSAFLDMRSRRRGSEIIPIRIISLWKLPHKAKILREQPLRWYHIKDEVQFDAFESYHCRVFYSHSEVTAGQLLSVRGQILTHKIFEEGLKIYAGTFLNCYVNATFAEYLVKNQMDVHVAIYPSAILDYPHKMIPVKVVQEFSTITPTMISTTIKDFLSNTVMVLCMRPLFGPMGDLAKVVQFVAFYTLMGVDEFYFYDFGLSPRVRQFLSNHPSVTLIRWNLPTGNWNELWDYGSLTALNDCLYRNMDKDWIIVADLDEFMVPRGNDASSRSIKSLIYQKYLLNFSQLLVRNTFFCKEFCPGSMNDKVEPYILSCFNRTKRIWNVSLRSKYIVRPRDVLQVGHHAVTEFLEVSSILPSSSKMSRRKGGLPLTKFRRFKSYIFPEDVLILNHYRECKSISTKKQPILGRTVVEDKSISSFGPKLHEILNSFNI